MFRPFISRVLVLRYRSVSTLSSVRSRRATVSVIDGFAWFKVHVLSSALRNGDEIMKDSLLGAAPAVRRSLLGEFVTGRRPIYCCSLGAGIV